MFTPEYLDQFHIDRRASTFSRKTVAEKIRQKYARQSESELEQLRGEFPVYADAQMLDRDSALSSAHHHGGIHVSRSTGASQSRGKRKPDPKAPQVADSQKQPRATKLAKSAVGTRDIRSFFSKVSAESRVPEQPDVLPEESHDLHSEFHSIFQAGVSEEELSIQQNLFDAVSVSEQNVDFQAEFLDFPTDDHSILQAGVSAEEISIQTKLFDDLKNVQNTVGGKEDQSGLSHDSLQR